MSRPSSSSAPVADSTPAADDDEDDEDAPDDDPSSRPRKKKPKTDTNKNTDTTTTTTTGGTGTGIVARFCPHLTKAACRASRGGGSSGDHECCSQLHFRPIRQPFSNPEAPQCTFLNKCRFRFTTCRYKHYELEVEEETTTTETSTLHSTSAASPPPFVYSSIAAAFVSAPLRGLPDPQWIQCDLRSFDLSLLGKFGVVRGVLVVHDTLLCCKNKKLFFNSESQMTHFTGYVDNTPLCFDPYFAPHYPYPIGLNISCLIFEWCQLV